MNVMRYMQGNSPNLDWQASWALETAEIVCAKHDRIQNVEYVETYGESCRRWKVVKRSLCRRTPASPDIYKAIGFSYLRIMKPIPFTGPAVNSSLVKER